jgi:hypothetical protein
MDGIVGVFPAGGREAPGFVGREGDEGGEDFDQRVEDRVQRGLRRTPQGMGGAERVEPVLQDVVIDGRQRDGAELVAELVNPVELVGVVGLGALVDQDGGLVQRPAVKRVQVFDRNGMLGRIEIEQVGELEAERVAEKPVGFTHVFQNFVIHRDVVAKVL